MKPRRLRVVTDEFVPDLEAMEVEDLPADLVRLTDRLHDIGEYTLGPQLLDEAARMRRLTRYCERLVGEVPPA